MPVALAVTWVARPGNEDRVAEILRRMVPLTQAEPGCVHYYAHQSPEDSRRFYLYEQYRDQAALDAHSTSDYFKDLVQGQALPLLESRERVPYTPL